MKLLPESFTPPAILAGCMALSLLTGCAGITGIGTSVGSPSNATGATVALNGTTHGGFNPISGALVTIYAAGSNFGAATPLAHATSASDGTFSLYYSSSSANDNSGATFQCPSAANQMYLVSSGGNTTGSSYTTGNSAVVLTTALGACSNLSSANAQVIINEVTTVGMAFAMGQFMSASGASVLVGAPADVKATSSIQGSNFSTGLANAYSTFLELADPGSGQYVKGISQPGAATSYSQMEYQKINTLANILSVCVNQTSSTGSACSSLFAAVAPPSVQTQVAAITKPTAAPTSTAQAAYYLAINPGQTSTNNTALFNMLPGTMPFNATDALSAAPNDWTVAIVYSTGANTCTANSTAFSPFLQPAELALDTSGNIWVTNSNTTANVVSEFSTVGKSLACADGTYVTGHAIAVDRNDNVWYTGQGTSTKSGDAGFYELVNGSTTPTPWPLAATTFQPYSIGIDKAGDILVEPFTSGYTLYDYVDATDATVAVAPVTGSGSAGRAASLLPSYYGSTAPDYGTTSPYLYADSTSTLYWALGSSATPPYTFASAQKTASGTISYTGRIATDNAGLIVGANEAGSSSPSATWFQSTPGTTAAPTYSAQFVGGLSSSGGAAVDGANNYWSALALPVSSGVYAFATVTSGLSAISPSGTPPSTCVYTSTCYTNGGYQLSGATAPFIDTAVDASGNVWGLMSSSTASNNGLVKLVGAAAPVATPLVNSIF